MEAVETKEKRKRKVINKTVPFRENSEMDRIILEYFKDKPFAQEAKFALFQHVMNMKMMRMQQQMPMMSPVQMVQMVQAMMHEGKNKA
jgi:hypothetical protein